MYGRVAYLCVAFLHHIAKVCEKFMNLKMIFCMNPLLSYRQRGTGGERGPKRWGKRETGPNTTLSPPE